MHDSTFTHVLRCHKTCDVLATSGKWLERGHLNPLRVGLRFQDPTCTELQLDGRVRLIRTTLDLALYLILWLYLELKRHRLALLQLGAAFAEILILPFITPGHFFDICEDLIRAASSLVELSQNQEVFLIEIKTACIFLAEFHVAQIRLLL